MEYEEDPVSAVYHAHKRRQDTDDRYELFMKLFPKLKFWCEIKSLMKAHYFESRFYI